jgi:hypothetical protein
MTVLPPQVCAQKDTLVKNIWSGPIFKNADGESLMIVIIETEIGFHFVIDPRQRLNKKSAELFQPCSSPFPTS